MIRIEKGRKLESQIKKKVNNNKWGSSRKCVKHFEIGRRRENKNDLHGSTPWERPFNYLPTTQRRDVRQKQRPDWSGPASPLQPPGGLGVIKAGSAPFGFDSVLKFMAYQQRPFPCECFCTKAMNQISCSSHLSLLCALVLSIWLSHLSPPRGSAGKVE